MLKTEQYIDQRYGKPLTPLLHLLPFLFLPPIFLKIYIFFSKKKPTRNLSSRSFLLQRQILFWSIIEPFKYVHLRIFREENDLVELDSCQVGEFDTDVLCKLVYETNQQIDNSPNNLQSNLPIYNHVIH